MNSAVLIHVGEVLIGRGFDLLRERPDKGYSLTDCVRRHARARISVAFAFDRHFEQEAS